MKYLLGFTLAIIALFWFFIVEFIRCSTTAFDDLFYFDMVTLVLLAAAVTIALGYVIFELTFGQRNKANIALATLFVACAALSFLFRFELNALGDKVFLWRNESEFRDRADGSIAVVKQVSSRNFHKLFLHATSRTVSEGTMSLETKDALGNQLEAFRGCKIVAKPLSTDFFLLSVDCGGR